MATNELKEDIKELEGFLESAKRPKVKDFLSIQVRKLQSELIRLEEKEKAAAEKKESKPPVPASTPSVRKIVKEIRNYAWDQSDAFVKFYVDIPGVHTIPESDIVAQYEERYLRFSAPNIGNTTYNLAVGPFHADAVPSQCKYKVKTDKVTILIKKAKEKETWPYAIQKEGSQNKKKPAAPSMDQSGDPNDGLMSMLKQMYEDGDDDMKRTIAKAWSESRNTEKTMPMP